MIDLSHIAEGLRGLAVEVDSLHADPANARKGHAVERIAASLRQYGQRKPIVVNRLQGNKVEAGNGTLSAARLLGWSHVAAVFVEDDAATATGFGIADNRTGDLSEWDLEALDSLLGSIDPDEIFTGFEAGELDDLLEEAGKGKKGDGLDAEPQIDRAEELRQEWGVELGQLWRLPSRTPGQWHMLICGDCTDAAVVERVMGGGQARLVMTSPPYWVGKDYENENTWDDIVRFIERCSARLAAACSHRIVINTGAPQAARLTGERAHTRLLLDEWIRELKQHGFLMRYVRIWAKRGGLAHTAPQSDCIDQHWEFVAVFYRPETYEGQRRLGEKWATDGIWDDFSGKMSSHGHIAAFPLEMPDRNIRLYTDGGHSVYEPFLGSGTTLIAAENLSRQCRAVEISPGYCAVALQRYLDTFGIRGELVE